MREGLGCTTDQTDPRGTEVDGGGRGEGGPELHHRPYRPTCTEVGEGG